MLGNERPIVGNAGDAKQIRGARGEERRRRKLELDDLRVVLRMPEGRRVIGRILDKCGLVSTTFSRDPLLLAFNEGGRSIATALLRDVTVADGSATLEIMKGWVPKPDPDAEKDSKDNESGEEHGD